MIIYSKYKDYYDSAGYMGEHDPSIVYKRETVELPDKDYRFLLKTLPSEPFRLKIKNKKCTYWVYVIFCGKFYYGTKLQSENICDSNYMDTKHTWDILRQEDVGKLKKGWRLFDSPLQSLKDSQKLDLTEINIKYKSPIVALYTNSHYNHVAEINPRLNQFNFASAINPWEAYQILEQFMDTHFVNPTIEDNIPQKYRFEMKGYSNVTSFRKDTDQRKRKQKKSKRKNANKR